MRTLARIALCIALAAGIGPTVSLADDAAPSKPVKIETVGGKKGAVLFDHKKHGEVKCETCHHKAHNEAGERHCTKCHKLADDAATKAPKIEVAMHKAERGVCFGCHRSEKAAKKFKCADCHKG